MRRLAGVVALGATVTGCLYLEDINFAPEVVLEPEHEGPYVRGEQVVVRARTSDRNASDEGSIRLEWLLTDGEGRPLTAEEAGPCEPVAPNCFVPLRLGLVYRVHATAVDPRGARTTTFRDFTMTNRGPAAALQAVGRRNPAGHYPLRGEIRFSALESTDPDLEDRCKLEYRFETLSRPLGSVTGVFVEERCAADDVLASCSTGVPAYCVRPDAPGTYRVRVTVTDPSGLSDTAEESVEVDPDAVPCLSQISPRPVETIFVSRTDGTRRFNVNVADDLDPFPPSDTNLSGYPVFTWSLQTAADPAPVAIPDYSSNAYTLDLLAFSVGEQVLVRVDVADRVPRSAERPCAEDSPVCPPGADPLDPEACVQRVTWKLEVY